MSDVYELAYAAEMSEQQHVEAEAKYSEQYDNDDYQQERNQDHAQDNRL